MVGWNAFEKHLPKPVEGRTEYCSIGLVDHNSSVFDKKGQFEEWIGWLVQFTPLPYTADFLQKENYTLNKLYQLCNLIEGDDFLKSLISQVHIDRLGEFLLIPILGNQKILLGNLTEIENKISNLKRFYTKVMPVEGWNKYSLINLKFRGQVVCKKIESSN